MKKNNYKNNPKVDLDILQERIKELSCLYDISTIALQDHLPIEETLVQMLRRMTEAWVHPDYAVIELIHSRFHLSTKSVYNQSVFLDSKPLGQQPIKTILRVHYPKDLFSPNDFLIEEQLLLNKLAAEVHEVIIRNERKQTEEQFFKSAEHLDRLAVLGEIAAGIGHELNTPLGNILGFAQFIENSSKEPQIVQDAKKIVKSTLYTREIVRKLMYFSSKMPQQLVPTSVNDLAKDAAELIKSAASKAKVGLRIIQDPTNPTAKLDHLQITQSVVNLLMNALHASKPGSEVELKIQANHAHVFITVADQGSGIPLELQDKIFEPFFTTKETGKGSGLGLSLVHGIISSHGGQILLSSLPGQGSTFNIKIPRYEAPYTGR